MKSLIALTVALSLALATTQTAQAGKKERAIFGGIVGGLIIGSMIDNHHDHHRHQNYSTVRIKPHNNTHHHDECGGHYDIVIVKEWVPGSWCYSYNNCGVRVRNYIKGHYINREERIWVSHAHNGHRRSHDGYYSDNRRISRHDRQDHHDANYNGRKNREYGKHNNNNRRN